jgi:dephospho-CoA kinase
MKPVIRLGVTGGIGSGKTTVCRVFECLSVPVYYADERARWLTEHHPQIRQEITALLGNESYTQEGKYNTQFVSSRVFGDSELLVALNRIVHPRVKEDTRLWVAQHAHASYVVKEAAIMSKASPKNELDCVLAVVSPELLRIERVMARDPHRTEDQIRSIMANQASEAELRALADFVVQNDEQTLLLPQVLALHEKLIAGSW